MKKNNFLIILFATFFIITFSSLIFLKKGMKVNKVSSPLPNNITDKISPTATIKPKKEGWKVYSKEVYQIYFKYPENYTIEENYSTSGAWMQVILNKNQNNSIFIKSHFSDKESVMDIYQDEEPFSNKIINKQKWNVFYYPRNTLPHGNPPNIVYVTWTDGVLLSVTFYNRENISNKDIEFLSTFEY